MAESNGAPSQKPKYLVSTTDADNAWAVSVAKGITEYLKRDQRPFRSMITLNQQEMDMLREAAKIQKVPMATIARACAMFGLAAFLQAKCKPTREIGQRVRKGGK